MALTTLIQGINDAVDRHLSPADVVHAVRPIVGSAMLDERFVLECAEATTDKAARCLLEGAPYEPLHIEHGRCWRMALFLWDPGFTNAPHQHNTWSVSGVMHNRLDVALYQRDAASQTLNPTQRFVAARGQTGFLVPPCIHALGNPDTTAPSVTLHVFNDSEDRAQRANDTLWFDDEVNPLDFYRDPARPSRRNLQTVLVLLKALARPAPAGLLARIFELGDARIRLEAYKQLVRADLATALACGDRLAASLGPQDRSRFMQLHQRLLAAHAATAPVADSARAEPSDEQAEYLLQQAVARLVCNSGLLARCVSEGAAVTFGDLPAKALALLAPTVQRNSRRLKILASILDQRLMDQVLRALPLSAALLSPEQARQLWRRYKDAQVDTTTPVVAEACRAFCAACVAEPGPALAEGDPVLDVMRYEEALLRISDRAARHGKSAPVSPPYLGPALVTNSETLHFKRAISPLVRTLRAAVQQPAQTREPALAAWRDQAAAVPAQDELLLFYEAWQDTQVRVLRITARTLLLLSACDGRRSLADLPDHLRSQGYALSTPQALAATLDRLAEAGVIAPLVLSTPSVSPPEQDPACPSVTAIPTASASD